MTEPLCLAELDWNEHGLPVSRRYGDVYFSNEGGLDEARHVFLAGNGLAERLAQADRITVGETGFGSGLNFLALWQLWERAAPAGSHLHFFSVEKHPLAAEDMARIHALFPEIARYGEELRANLPLPVPGFHRIRLAGGRILLTLMYGDALDMLRAQEAQADAWFLDGFAPRLNPDLWSAELAREIRRLSRHGATAATFSTSTSTQEALSAAGFMLEKRPGFGRKKHMLAGQLPGRAQPYSAPEHVTIIGGGLAGAAAAYALAQRGTRVTLWEKRETVAAGASANPSAIFYPGVTVGWQAQTAFYFMGYAYALHLLEQFPAVVRGRCGMLLFPKPHETQARLRKVVETMRPDASVFRHVGAEEASELAGIALREGGLYFPRNGWLDVAGWTRALLDHPLITVRTGEAGRVEGVTILCNGWEAEGMHPALSGTMHPVRGQVSCIPSFSPLQGLRCVLSYGGYLTPAIDGRHHLGATYARGRMDTDCDAGDHALNTRKLQDFLHGDIPEATGGWAALRSVTRDRLPLVGQVEEGLYASLAHASRGLLSCALSGEYLASLLHGEPLPLPRDAARRVHPLRFV